MWNEDTHTLSYLATDAAGNTGSISRVVTYIKNPDAEILTLNGEAQLTIEAAVAWTDPGVTITHEDGTPAEGLLPISKRQSIQQSCNWPVHHHIQVH